MLLQVHDELVFEAPEQEVEATRKLAKYVMEAACAPVLTFPCRWSSRPARPRTGTRRISPAWTAGR